MKEASITHFYEGLHVLEKRRKKSTKSNYACLIIHTPYPVVVLVHATQDRQTALDYGLTPNFRPNIRAIYTLTVTAQQESIPKN